MTTSPCNVLYQTLRQGITDSDYDQTGGVIYCNTKRHGWREGKRIWEAKDGLTGSSGTTEEGGERQTDRDRHRHRETHREKGERERAERETDRQTEIETERQTGRDRDRE